MDLQVPFLDQASTFRQVDLSKLDLGSDEALCFFANLYHVIVRHMLLVLGPPPSAKVINHNLDASIWYALEHTLRTVLAELGSC